MAVSSNNNVVNKNNAGVVIFCQEVEKNLAHRVILFCWFHGSSFKGISIVFPAP